MAKRKADSHSANTLQDSHGNNSRGSLPLSDSHGNNSRGSLPLSPAPEITQCSPESAARQVQELLNFSESELNVLIGELHKTDEDPILALRVNPAWIAIHDEARADDVLDFIANFEMPQDMRRNFEGGHNFLFHFNISSDIVNCRKATLGQFPEAFALSPSAAAVALGLGAVGVSSVPLASGAIIHKLAVRQHDVQAYDFFYL